MHPVPEGFELVAGTDRVTATAVVFDVRAAQDRGSSGPGLVCKRLGSRASDEPWVRARLSSEGGLLKRLGGAGTPWLVAAGEDAHGPFIVMERAPGMPLAARIGTASPGWIADAARSVLTVLARLHEAGIIHADINPDNVLVPDDARTAIVLDFGLALYPGAPAMPVGPFRGSPVYAAPELARGEPFDARADLFGLAATLLHVASATSPRPQESEAAVLLAAGDDDLSPWAERAARGMPPPAAALLRQCCAFEARARPASAREALSLLGL